MGYFKKEKKNKKVQSEKKRGNNLIARAAVESLLPLIDMRSTDKDLAIQLDSMQIDDDSAVVLAIVKKEENSFLKYLQLKKDGTFAFLAMEVDDKEVFEIPVTKWLEDMIKKGLSKM